MDVADRIYTEYIEMAKAESTRKDGIDVVAITMPNHYATHKHPSVTAWIEKHPRFHLHFIPTRSSWLNLVERWFAEITRKRIRRGSFKSVADLVEAIQLYIDHNNSNPKPFVWTKRVDQILERP